MASEQSIMDDFFKQYDLTGDSTDTDREWLDSRPEYSGEVFDQMSKEYMKKANLYADLWISGMLSILCGIALYYVQGWFWEVVYDGLIETELYLRTLIATG